MWFYLGLFIWLNAPESSAGVGMCKTFCLSVPFSISVSVQFGLSYILTSHCLVHLFIKSLFYSSMHSLNTQEICFIRHAHGVLSCPSVYLLLTEIPLILQYPCQLLLSQWNLYDIFLFYLLYSYPLMAAHPLLLSSPRMLFVILSCVLSSCSVVLRKAWPYPWVLIPWAYFVWSWSVFSEDICPI